MSERTNRIALIAAALTLLLIVPGLYEGGMMQITVINQLGRFLCLAIVALGLDLVWGYSGILSLCQAMFFCIGGYCMGMHLALHGPLDGDGIPRCLYVVTSQVSGFSLPWFWEPLRTFPMAVVLALAVPGMIAFLFGYLSFRSRVRGVYLSIITQALTVIAVLLFRRNELRLCGTNGLTNFETLLGFDLRADATKLGLYWVSAAALVASYLVCRHLVRSRAGRILIAVRDNESRLRFSGYHPVHFKTFVFTLGAILAALGGMLYTPQNGIITPAKMEPYESIYMVIWVAVGGRGTLAGAVIGALAVNGLASLLTSVAPITWPFLVAGSAIGVVLYTPDGLLGLWQRLSQRWWPRRGDGDAALPDGDPDQPGRPLATTAPAGPPP
jgi:urea transport system permease protein